MPVKERRRLTLMLLTQPFVLVALGAGTDFADNVSQEFYAVAAQVIPVLVLAVFVQLHAFIGPGGVDDREQARMRLLSTEMLFFAIAGELMALAALAFHWPSGLPFAFSCWAIVLILLMLAAVLVMRFEGDS